MKNEGRMLALQIWIFFAIACAETLENVETINVPLENGDVPQNNVAPRLWKRNKGAGIFGDHIKRWNHFKDTKKIWLWSKGVVPYIMGTGFTTPERQLIWETMTQIKKNSCIKFQQRRKERDYVEFQKSEKGCSVFIGRLKGRNLAEFDSGCLERRTDLLHQMMHVLGFYDQHNVPGRDKWLKIDWDNVRSDKKTYFDIAKARTLDAQQPYDFNSLMQLAGTTFSNYSYQHTMWPKFRVQRLGPLSEELSSHDLYKIQKLYSEECRTRLNEDKGSTRTGGGKNKSGNAEKPDGNGNGAEPNEPSKKPSGEKDQLTPHMICVFWPVTIGNSSSKKVVRKRLAYDALSPKQRTLLFGNYESGEKCPPWNDAVAT